MKTLMYLYGHDPLDVSRQNNLILKMAFAFLPTECFDQSNIVQDNTSFPPKEKQAWLSAPLVDKHGQLLLVLYIEKISF